MKSTSSNQNVSASMPLATAWLGGELSYLEKLCLTSAVHVGHHVVLYAYSKIENTPHGVEIRDASQILPKENFLRYQNGSYALGSNLFRYKLLSQTECIWIDTDVFFLKKIENLTDYLFGWEDSKYINTAVFGLPKNSDMLTDINSFISQDVFFAPWWSVDQTKKQEEAISSGCPLRLSELPWATTGPKLITHLADKHQVANLARSSSVFYPIHWRDYELPFLDSDVVEESVVEETIAIHLWNHMLGDLKSEPLNPASFVGKQCKKFKIQI